MNNNLDEFIFQDFHIHASGYRIGSAGQMTIDDSMIVEVIVRRAEELGLKSICILEHLEPVSGRHPWRDSPKILSKILPGFNWNFGFVPARHIEEIVKITSGNNVYLEISIHAIERYPEYLLFINKLKEAGAFFSIGSDAHNLVGLKSAEAILGVLAENGINSNRLMGNENANRRNI